MPDSDPRVQPLLDAMRRITAQSNYDPHFANIAEREIVETHLFLARIDTLREIERAAVIPVYTTENGIRGARSVPRQLDPIPMILFCPSCGVQHIDAPEPHKPTCPIVVPVERPCGEECNCGAWTNPPHRSHACHYCNHVWRPADVPTTGVKEITTQGQHDSPEIIRGVIDKTARFRPRWRHKSRQTVYSELGRGELQRSRIDVQLNEGARMVAYKGADNKVYVRSEEEFDDGRFEPLAIDRRPE